MSYDIIVEVDDSNWEKIVEKNTKPVVVMFYSPTCPHCRTLDPYFQEYAEEYKNTLLFLKANILNNSTSVGRYGVMGTPTIKFFCQGRPVKELVGAVYPSMIKKTIEDMLQYGDECIKKSTAIDYTITGYS